MGGSIDNMEKVNKPQEVLDEIEIQTTGPNAFENAKRQLRAYDVDEERVRGVNVRVTALVDEK